MSASLLKKMLFCNYSGISTMLAEPVACNCSDGMELNNYLFLNCSIADYCPSNELNGHRKAAKQNNHVKSGRWLVTG